MSNPQYTRKANTVVSLRRQGVTEGGGWSGTTSDPHPPVGNEQGSTRLARVEVHFPEPTWPRKGRLVSAHLTVHESGTNAHPGYDGSNGQASVERINETPNRDTPSSTGGSAKVFSVNGSETHDVTALVGPMLPSTIMQQGSTPDSPIPGGNRPYGWFSIRSSDESNDQRSFIITDDLHLTVEVETALAPDAPLIVSISGAQEPTNTGSGATVVASADGRTLQVVFAFRGTPGDYPEKARLDLYGVGATDAFVTPFIAGTGWVVPKRVGGAGQYSITLSGIPLRAAGRFRINTISHRKGSAGTPSSLDGDEAWVQLVVLSGPPLDITFQPFTADPHILFSLNDPNPSDYLTSAEVEATFKPQGTVAAGGPVQLTGTTRRADIAWSDIGGKDLAPGQVISYRVRTTNQDGVVSGWSAPRDVTVYEPQAVTYAPDPGRLTSTTPTITLTFPLADGARLRLLDPDDDTKVVYDTGATVLVNQTSHAFVIPAGKLAYGQRFRAVGSYVPDGGGTTYLPENIPAAVTYSVAGLPTATLSVPAAVAGKVGTTDPAYLRTVTDPDGASGHQLDQEIRVAATPQGTGALVTEFVGGQAVLTAIPGGTIAFETAADTRLRATNDVALLASTTLNGAISAGATGCTLTSGTGFVTGQVIQIGSTVSGQVEDRTATIAGTAATWTDPLEHAHASGQPVYARQFGPWSPWLTITALQPPDVDLITPVNGATITDPTQALDWSVTGHGGRTQASAVVTIYTAAGDVLLPLPIADGTSVSAIPAYLLDDATTYGWDVTVTDTQGMVTTSARRTFTTAFTEPVGVTAVVAVPDPDSGTVAVTWDDSLEPFLDHYEVIWTDDEGSPVRIDGGPESLLDGNAAFTGTSLTHIGARLGTNVYYVAVSNGWRSSDPVSTSEDLDQPATNLGSWHLVADGVFVQLRSLGQPIVTAGIIERMQAPGGQPRELAWGLAARTVSMTVDIRPTVDGPLSTTLRTLMADARRARSATPCWLQPPAGWLWDPIWVTLQGFTDSPGTGGRTQVAIDLAELGDPVHAILPPVVAPPDTGEGDLFVTTDTLDFGTLVVGS